MTLELGDMSNDVCGVTAPSLDLPSIVINTDHLPLEGFLGGDDLGENPENDAIKKALEADKGGSGGREGQYIDSNVQIDQLDINLDLDDDDDFGHISHSPDTEESPEKISSDSYDLKVTSPLEGNSDEGNGNDKVSLNED